MQTEKYTLIFSGHKIKYYNEDFVALLWSDSANKEYHNSGIFVNSLIEEKLLVWNKACECSLDDKALIITV